MDELSVLDTFRLDGRKALVTGGSKGLGKVMAHALAEVRADVALVSRNLRECEETAQEISASTGRMVKSYAADLTKSDHVTRLGQEIRESFGEIDVLINNAGINIRGSIEELTEDSWDQVLDINLKGTFLCAKEFGPAMAQRGWGRIINLGSTLSVIGLPGRTPYCAAKSGVIGLTKVLALEWAERGVTVNAICPGPFATEMNRPLLNDPEKYQALMSKIPMGRWGDLPEIAGAAVFLASPAASFITGTSLFIDGGWTAQ